MKKILGLDLGTNSIGWAVVNEKETEEEKSSIDSAGSRIIPMDAAILGNFDEGESISQTAERTKYRGIRRLRERQLLRRERLNRVLMLLDFLPIHYVQDLDRYGKIIKDKEPKLAWIKDETGKAIFLFQASFNEMLEDFKHNSPINIPENKKIPYDWTIYYLRKKALSSKITKQELAWLLLNFNQKRGYYQLREEVEEVKTENKRIEYKELKVLKVEKTEDRNKDGFWYNVYLEEDLVYRRTSKQPLDNWEGKVKEFIITTDLNDDDSEKLDKYGEIKRSFRAPNSDDWTLIKTKTEAKIKDSEKTVGTYIYDTLLSNPNQKINGKLVQTIERKFYKEELIKILEVQTKFHSELQDRDLYNQCIEILYQNNLSHKKELKNKKWLENKMLPFTSLFVNDILFYQRPLKSKKHLISDCPYEKRKYTDKETGEEKPIGIKCIAKSNPLYQEFRLWQFIGNLRIYKKETANDVDVTAEFLKTAEDYTNLFDFLNDKKEVTQDNILKYEFFGIKKNELSKYRWNYVEDKKYPCNETRYIIASHLKKAEIPYFENKETELALWHILYSIEDKNELEKALKKFARKNNLNEAFVEEFKNCPAFKKEYGSYSEKAIKKLLPLMRMGKYWDSKAIDPNTLQRIDKILTGEDDEAINDRTREKLQNYKSIEDFKGLPLWLASYVVYSRHSEATDIQKWNTPEDIDNYLRHFKQHSLRNPIVEQVVLETLRTVRDIWQKQGKIDEIHIELGREMKKTKEERKKLSKQISENEETNHRIKCLLTEFMNPEMEIEDVRPYSPSQQEILKIYENTVLNTSSEIPKDIDGIKNKFKETDEKKRPTKSDVIRYKTWLDQNYRSPYTGAIIPLGRLFTTDYEIEHIIPKAVYFDDSLSNKVICETEVNKLKGKMLGYEFISNHHGEKVQLSNGKTAQIYSLEEYERNIEDTFSKSTDPTIRAKRKKLLMTEIPEEFIARQLNDSRYISKVIKGILSNIVREEGEEEAISKNVITLTGGVTDRLKKDWGVNDVWNRIILPRFERLNKMTETNYFTAKNTEGHTIPTMPLDLQKGFNPKRIDHRHHAMDAIIIALASRNMVNYLNNSSASKNAKTTRHDLKKILCYKKETDPKGNDKWLIKMPWKTFPQDVFNVLENIVVSFKQNLRVLNTTANKYTHYDKETGKKKQVAQTKGDRLAIRKPLHKETVFGEVNLRFIKAVSLKDAIKTPQNIVDKVLKKEILNLSEQGYDSKQMMKYFEDNKEAWQEELSKKVKVYYFTKETKDRYFAVRKSLNNVLKSCNAKTNEDKENYIRSSITDTAIHNILINHLASKNYDMELAFSSEGIEDMNKNIQQLNNGKFHQPILKVRTYEKANKFAVGQQGNKNTKFVEAATGTNLFFAVYEGIDEQDNETKQRSFETIPLNEAIERQKQGLNVAEEEKDGKKLAFVLSPNDLVYLPTAEEQRNGISNVDTSRIYKFVNSSKGTANFIPYYVAKTIFSMKKDDAEILFNNPKPVVDEFGGNSTQSKNQKSISNSGFGDLVKETCVPLKVDRLGNVSLK